mmetsp:Transcript_6875/g.13832  ORF Transcript_6875/g.13832 Transcript_6875/m.13832 type:complete len:388 (-) Transcript_6875:185-1348(-)
MNSKKGIDILKNFFLTEKEFSIFQTEGYFYHFDFQNLKQQLIISQNEISRFQAVPLVVGQFFEQIDSNYGIVGSTTGNNYLVRIISTIDRGKLKPNISIVLHRNSNALVNFLENNCDSSINIVSPSQKPEVKYSEIGGLENQKEEIRESIEFPLLNHGIFEKIGVEPPKGILLFGPPGTGKTMVVKAIAFKVTASFIKAVGSEFVQKYLGEGPRMVRDLFKVARENSPAIIFIDEIDAIATRRFDAQTGADREVQRILMELLNQMDGFEENSDIKIIMCTNRIDTLDPALLRPGRIDRKIEFPLPTVREKRFMFHTLASKMNLSEDLYLEEFITKPDKLSGAVIAAICQEAGMQAIRKDRYIVIHRDFQIAYTLNVGLSPNLLDFYQ